MPVLLLRWSYVCGVCGVFSAALVYSLVPCSSYGACGFAHLPLPSVTLRGFCIFSAYVCLPDCCAGGVGWAAALPLRYQCFCAGWLADDRWVLHPVTGLSHWRCDCSLYGSVVVPYGSPSLWALFVVLSSPPAVLSLCGCCALFSFWFPLLQGGCASGLRCLGHTLPAKLVQSRLPFVVGPTSAVSVCPSPALAGQVVLFCCPGSLSFLNSLLGFLSSRFQCLLIARGGWRIVLGYPPSVAWLPGSLSFLNSLLVFLSSRFQCLLIARGGWRIVLGYPPSVAWLREVLPCFSVRGLSACPSGAAVPLGSSVLWGSGSSRWGHLSQVGSVFFLSPRS